mgnify:CR=1 FL=1
MRTLNDYFITSAIPDVSAASSTFVVVPDGGKIIKIFAHNLATTTGTAAITFEIDGTACATAAISHIAASSAGKQYTSLPAVAPTAAVTTTYLPAAEVETIKVSEGEKIAVLRIGDTDGELYVTELTE